MDLFEYMLTPCKNGDHLLEYHKTDEQTGTIYDYCEKCGNVIPREM